MIHLRLLSLVVLSLLAGAARSESNNKHRLRNNAEFPCVVTVTTTPSIAARYASGWDILRRESRKEVVKSSNESAEDTTLLHLNIIVHTPTEWETLDQLTSSEDDQHFLTFQVNEQLTDQHLRIPLQRNLKEQKQQQSIQGDERQILSEELDVEDGWYQAGFDDCYRTVQQTFESLANWEQQYPDWVTIKSLGPSLLRVADPSGVQGHDIPIAVVDVPSTAKAKAPLMIVCGHHVRELTPPETGKLP